MFTWEAFYLIKNVCIAMLRKILPKFINKQLFGDREKYGQKAWDNDPDWEKWLSLYTEVYELTQRKGSVQAKINDAGYEVISTVNLNNKTIGEIGPGGCYHTNYFNGTPEHYHAFDVCSDFFPTVQENLKKCNISSTCHKIDAYSSKLPIEDNSLDVMFSFYSMEHLYPLDSWLDEIFRVLKPGGKLIGAIPTEGGLAWGLGRFITSKRAVKRDYDIDLIKIVCWEHPNTCDEIIKQFKKRGKLEHQSWPFSFLPFDTNLIIKYITTKN